jgi:hypothetical protein
MKSRTIYQENCPDAIFGQCLNSELAAKIEQSGSKVGFECELNRNRQMPLTAEVIREYGRNNGGRAIVLNRHHGMDLNCGNIGMQGISTGWSWSVW